MDQKRKKSVLTKNLHFYLVLPFLGLESGCSRSNTFDQKAKVIEAVKNTDEFGIVAKGGASTPGVCTFPLIDTAIDSIDLMSSYKLAEELLQDFANQPPVQQHRAVYAINEICRKAPRDYDYKTIQQLLESKLRNDATLDFEVKSLIESLLLFLRRAEGSTRV